MKIVLVGATALSVATAKILIGRGEAVVMIERDKARIDALAQELDCGFIHGDGTKPAILREAGPADSQLLLCLTDNDQANILAGLVGRSLGFPRVVPKIDDPEFEHICIELSLGDTIVPHRHIARALADLALGREAVDLSTFVKGEVRMFSFVAGEEDGMTVGELKLPDRCAIMCIYRGNDFALPDQDTKLKKGDEIVLICHSRQIGALEKRWGAAGAGAAAEGSEAE